jgi:hypothetical protein
MPKAALSISPNVFLPLSERIHDLGARNPLRIPSKPVRVLEIRFSGVVFHHHLQRDLADFTQFVGGVNAQRLMSNPVLDGAQQRRSRPVGEERMLLADIHGRCSRDARRQDPDPFVFQNAGANGDALVTDISPRIITGARNKLRNGILRFSAKRAVEDPCISLPHLYISTLENTVVFGPIRVPGNTGRSVGAGRAHAVLPMGKGMKAFWKVTLAAA